MDISSKERKNMKSASKYINSKNNNNGFKEDKNRRIRENGRNELPILITGGAGFIGTNLAHRFLSSGKEVIIFDNLSRPGVEENLRWLKGVHGDLVKIVIEDVRNRSEIQKVIDQVECVYHFAAQVAVTTSLNNPVHDFEVNAKGAINILESIRLSGKKIPLIFTSTNKVYGGLTDLIFIENGTRYIPVNSTIKAQGINEERHLDFHSPYGCSKGAADQYILDYSRSFELPTIVFRMSCIYGSHQFGTEDQGWVAHFLIQSLKKKKLTIYGNGKQVRDILYVEDLVDAFLLAKENIERLKGEAYNIGGGSKNTISLLELIDLIKNIRGYEPEIDFEEWRIGDQKYYVTDFTKFSQTTGWNPKIEAEQGIKLLTDWLDKFYFENKKDSSAVLSHIINKKEIIYR